MSEIREKYEDEIDPHIELYNKGRYRWMDLTNAIALLINGKVEEEKQRIEDLLREIEEVCGEDNYGGAIARAKIIEIRDLIYTYKEGIV